MPMDGFTLSFMQRELRNTLLGGRVDKVNQPERDALVLLIRSGKEWGCLGRLAALAVSHLFESLQRNKTKDFVIQKVT